MAASSAHSTGNNNDFFDDSPYFDAFVHKEMCTVGLLTDALKDIGMKTKAMVQSSEQMALNTRRLAISCRPDKNDRNYDVKKEVFGPKMFEALNELGAVLDKIASAQDHMCQFLEASIVSNLENFAIEEVKKTYNLQQDLKKQTEGAENLFFQYINNDDNNPHGNGASSGGGGGSGGGSAGHHSSATEKKKSSYFGSKIKKAAEKAAAHYSGSTSSGSSTSKSNKDKVENRNPILTQAIRIARLKHSAQQIRYHQTAAEIRRFQFSKRILDTKYEHTKELHVTTNQLLYGMQRYFHQCSTILKDNMPIVQQKALLENNKSIVVEESKWKERQKLLNDLLTELKFKVTNANNDVRKTLLSDPLTFGHKSLDLDCMENDVQIWNLPVKLSSCTQFSRMKPPGVLYEGWLYQKTRKKDILSSLNKQSHNKSSASAKVSKSSSSNSSSKKYTWQRRWLVLREDGIFHYEISTSSDSARSRFGFQQPKKSTNQPIVVNKCKLCDLLCTVRELKPIDGAKDHKNNPTIPSNSASSSAPGSSTTSVEGERLRFCFELIAPRTYTGESIILQARGPLEYNTWINAINSAIANDLATVQPYSKKEKSTATSNTENQSQHYGELPNSSSSIGRMQEQQHQLETKEPSDEVRVTILEKKLKWFAEGTWEKPKIQSEKESKPDDDRKTNGSSHSSQPDLSAANLLDQISDPLVKRVIEANPLCAECGKKNPDWVSLNLGVLVCLECSGVHRSLGVHVSKVRSLALDSLSKQEARLLLCLGNDCVNEFWENDIGTREKPDDAADRRTREEWIKSKYLYKEFLSKTTNAATDIDPTEAACRDLYEASKRGDVIDMAKALAHGGLVSWKNLTDDNQTVLEVCGQLIPASEPTEEEDRDVVNCESDDITPSQMVECCVELLQQNGAKAEGDCI